MWYLILSRPSASREAIGPKLPDHLRWMRARHLDGKVLFSGPTPDRSVGIYVILATSKEQATAIADSDPLHANALRTYEMLEWEVHQVLGTGGFTSQAIAALQQQ